MSRVLVTGHDGYIGVTLVPMLEEAGHDVVGLDSFLYDGCGLGPPPPAPAEVVRKDVRDVSLDDLEGIDAVVHLAAISNDPVGDLNPDCTEDLNLRATVRLAELAKQAGVERFVFSSSCSLYGAGAGGPLDEDSPFNPVTPYGRTKIEAERQLTALADDDFSPTYLRNATVYGFSPRIRGDLVVNNLTAHAVASGRVLLKSDGTPWRPLVHVEDVSRAFVEVLAADRELVHDEPFNVGSSEENYQIRTVANLVGEVVEDAEIVFAPGASSDARDYRIDSSKLDETLPGARTRWTVRKGIEQLADAYQRHGLQDGEVESSRLRRIHRVKELIASGELDEMLRWRDGVPADPAAVGR